MGRERCWKRNNFRTSMWLLSCTLMLMFLLIVVEFFVFNPNCGDCAASEEDRTSDGIETSIDRLRSLVKSPGRDLQLLSQEVNSRGVVPESDSRLDSESEEQDETDTRDNSASKSEENSDELDGRIVKTNGESAIDERRYSNPPPKVKSTWYYTNVYKAPESKVRVLTAEDGAPRLQSKSPLPERAITIVSQASQERLPPLKRMCMTWGGVLCIAVYVRVESEIAGVYAKVEKMHQDLEKDGRCWLDIQMVIEDSFDTDAEALQASYPLNAVRNVGIAMAPTKLIVLLDADFLPSYRMHESLTENEEIYQYLLTQATKENQLFVVPAFEASTSEGKRTSIEIPKTMEELTVEWKNGNVNCFHCHHSPTGHVPTNHTIFFDPETRDPYTIPYRDGFEPYVLGAKDVIPLYDTRFRGYGEDKVAHMYYCAAKGMGFQVIPNRFIFEMPHPPSDDHEIFVGKRKDQNRRNFIIGLYRQFKSEVGREMKKKDPEQYRRFLDSIKK